MYMLTGVWKQGHDSISEAKAASKKKLKSRTCRKQYRFIIRRACTRMIYGWLASSASGIIHIVRKVEQ